MSLHPAIGNIGINKELKKGIKAKIDLDMLKKRCIKKFQIFGQLNLKPENENEKFAIYKVIKGHNSRKG